MDLSPDNTAEQTCQLVLRISVQAGKRDRFLLELAGRVENFSGAKILSVEFARTGTQDPRPALPLT